MDPIRVVTAKIKPNQPVDKYVENPQVTTRLAALIVENQQDSGFIVRNNPIKTIS